MPIAQLHQFSLQLRPETKEHGRVRQRQPGVFQHTRKSLMDKGGQTETLHWKHQSRIFS